MGHAPFQISLILNKHLWFIHGNLQQPNVWNTFSLTHSPDYIVHKENLWLSQAKEFNSWAKEFCTKVSSYSPSKNQHHLIAYSLGGRLGFHALIQHPELWTTATIIASDTGLESKASKEKQLAWDRNWAEKFLKEDWESLISEWNKLAIFQGRPNPRSPKEEDFSREAIAKLFIQFSKGKQDNLLPLLTNKQLPPIHYITGIEDLKYCQKAKDLEDTNEAIQHHIIDNAGHRVPWENPEAFEKLLKNILAEF